MPAWLIQPADGSCRLSAPCGSGWIDAASRVTGPIPVIVAGNKQDLTESAEIGPEDVARFAQGSGHDFVMTSAKTGEGVEEAFRRLATRIALRVVGDS